MIVIPKETPVIEELNSYYLNIERLIEYYQTLVDSGCMYFQTPSSEGVIFFDSDSLINGTYRDKALFVRGESAIDILFKEARTKKVMISIYEIPQESIIYWANVGNALDLYKDLSTEFTDLEGLIRKMTNDRLTGYIEVAFKAEDIGILFLHNGKIIGTVSAESKGQLATAEKFQPDLVEKARKIGAVLNVRRIPLEPIAVSRKPRVVEDRHVEKSGEKDRLPENVSAPRKEDEKPLHIIEMLQYLMLVYEKFIAGNRKIKDDFATILKRKFVDKVETYDFLDPFSGEFRYMNGKIEYSGVDEVHLATGLLECLNEIAVEHDMKKWLDKSLWPLREKFSREIDFLKATI